MIERLLVATTNPGKLREFAEALGAVGIEVAGLEALGDVPEVEETGATFAENARIKAEAYSRLTKLPTLADDSGLEVDALDGAPGVHSARYGGPGLDDRGRNAHLLAAVQDVPQEKRTARFRCALALAVAGSTIAECDGTVEGQLLREERGAQGFGYDPLFFYPPFDCTLAEVPASRKRTVSHRGTAIARLVERLPSLRLFTN